MLELLGWRPLPKRQGVEFVQTMNGAELLKNENHTSMRIRLIDIETKDPVTGEYKCMSYCDCKYLDLSIQWLDW